jgi:hypothetical protein
VSSSLPGLPQPMMTRANARTPRIDFFMSLRV